MLDTNIFSPPAFEVDTGMMEKEVRLRSGGLSFNFMFRALTRISIRSVCSDDVNMDFGNCDHPSAIVLKIMDVIRRLRATYPSIRFGNQFTIPIGAGAICKYAIGCIVPDGGWIGTR